jgi:hypothetical protein
VADRPLRPATRRCLGRPLPHQLADKPRAHPTAQRHFLEQSCGYSRIFGINPGFPGLSRSVGQVAHVLLTRSPLRHTGGLPLRCASLDLHALGTPPAFVLSQDQTLQRTFKADTRRRRPILSVMSLQLGPGPVRGPRADCYTDAHSPRRPLRAGKWVCMLAFGTLFSCQGAQSSHCGCQSGRRRHLRPLADVFVTPIQSESEATRKRRRPGVQWVAGDVFPSRESNSNDTPELVKSMR